ncbi:MAG: MOSC domain-containing protein [Saprospiraceae bacterium]|nr:MOSC domain-containing protein [Saprospiraceae bacterium]
MKLTALYLYPVKSMGGISLQEATAEKRGLQYDRRWMLTDREGMFLSQRELPEMALLQPAIENGHLIIRHQSKPLEPLHIPLDPVGYGAPCTVRVWEDTCAAVHVGEHADAWFGKALNAPCHLVYMPDSSIRPVSPDYALPGDMVSFADGYPFLIIGEPSMAYLNSKLETPLSIRRFRPNFVFSGNVPHEEDEWKSFSIGSVRFRGTKPCGRCQIPAIDQETLIQGKEPTATLAKYRRFGHAINFGMNVCLNGAPGIVRVGEEVVVEE